jgi:hypothetical protein
MGCVNWSLRYFDEGKVSREAMDRARIAARLEVQSLERRYRALGWEECIGSSGTVLAIEQILRVNEWSDGGITAKGLRKLRRELVDIGSVAQFTRIQGLEPERAPVIAGGVAILTALFDGLAPDWHTRDSPQRRAVVSDCLERGLGAMAWTGGTDTVGIELGSGTGIYSDLVAGVVGSAVAVDLSDAMLREAPSAPAARLRGDSSALPLRSGAADLAAVINMFLFPGEIARVRAMILGTGAEGYMACASAVRDMAQTTMLLEVKAPTLVMTGRQDPACTVAPSTVLHRMIDGSRLVILEDAAHLANVEQPEAFNRALRAFLDEVDDRLPASA